ncbi:MAG: hypothetical protein PHP83_03435 [Clostridia bacterium]|nr:hypothetical protein [Clostridia bacterium]
MNENRLNFDLVVLTDSYKNSRSFTMEKKYDFSRYLCKSSTFFDKFKKEYVNFELLNKEYEHSLLAQCKAFVNSGDYGVVNSKLITDNIMDVNYRLTKKGKTREFSEKKLKDSLVSYLEKYFTLKKYSDFLNYYKDSEMDNYRSSICTKFSKNNEFSAVEMVVDTTEKALYVWAGNKSDVQAKTMVNHWLIFLKTNLPLKENNELTSSYDDDYFQDLTTIYSEKLSEIAEISEFFKKFLSNKDYVDTKKHNLVR